ncbi:hypothetical protein [Neotabrizicola sp. sgz301269]|uniref:hypothetical protein n=1 Tax=Neotabrizicola sp. sgz301269 TaxID=3276282 RepID=UPI0037705B93
MSDEIEWGPWIEHDGKGCQLADGEFVHGVEADGEEWMDFIKKRENAPGEVDVWDWEDCAGNFGWHLRLIRYRIRKPRSTAMDRLAEIVANPSTPITAPEGPTREKVPANNTRDRA